MRMQSFRNSPPPTRSESFRNHPFVDGNKRAGFVVMLGFLLLNRIEFAPDPTEATAIIFGVAAGEINEMGLARWIRDNWPKA